MEANFRETQTLGNGNSVPGKSPGSETTFLASRKCFLASGGNVKQTQIPGIGTQILGIGIQIPGIGKSLPRKSLRSREVTWLTNFKLTGFQMSVMIRWMEEEH